MRDMKQRFSVSVAAYAALLMSMFFWAANAVAGKWLLTTVPPAVLSVIRWVVALAIMVPLTLVKDGFPWSRIRKHWKGLVVMGLTGVTGYHTLLYVSLDYTNPVNVTLLNTLVPVFVAVFSLVYLRTKLVPVQLAGMFIAFSGVLVVLSRGSLDIFFQLQFNRGDLLMLVTIVLWAIYSMASVRVMEALPLLTSITWSCLFGLAILLPFGLANYWAYAPLGVSGFQYILLLFLGIGPSFLAFLGWNYGVRAVGPVISANFMYFVPVMTAVLSLFILRDPIGLFQVIGGAVIMIGVGLLTNAKTGSG